MRQAVNPIVPGSLWAVLLPDLVSCGSDTVVAFDGGDETVAQGSTLEWDFDDQAPGRPPEGASIFDGAWTVSIADDPGSEPNEVAQRQSRCISDVVKGDRVRRPRSGRPSPNLALH